MGKDMTKNLLIGLDLRGALILSRVDELLFEVANLKFDHHLSELHNEYKNNNLVFFLGAGVSISAGLPSWDSLLEKLTQEMLKRVQGYPILPGISSRAKLLKAVLHRSSVMREDGFLMLKYSISTVI